MKIKVYLTTRSEIVVDVKDPRTFRREDFVKICTEVGINPDKTTVEHTEPIYEVGMRVEVKSGDRSQSLGGGKYLGAVKTFALMTPNGDILTVDESIIQAQPGTEVVTIHDNKKIELDDGKIVYGSEVYHGPAPVDPPKVV